MKKNSGFTLIELLAVVVILGIVASYATINIMKLYEKNRIISKITVVNEAFTGLKSYLTDHPSEFNVTPQILIDNNLLSNDDFSEINGSYFTVNTCPVNTVNGVYYSLSVGGKNYSDCGCMPQEKFKDGSGKEIDAFLICDSETSGFTKAGKHYNCTGTSCTLDPTTDLMKYYK